MTDSASTSFDATWQIRLKAANHQYQIQSDSERWDPFPESVDGVLTGEDGWFAVITGVQDGPVDVTIRLGTAPVSTPLTDYDMVSERDLDVDTGSIEVRETFTPHPVLTIDVAAGLYRARVSVADRWAASLNTGTAEHHLVELWPTAAPQPPGLLSGLDEFSRAYLGRK